MKLPAPVDQGALGDVELFGDAEIGPALGTEPDELLLRFLIFHGRHGVPAQPSRRRVARERREGTRTLQSGMREAEKEKAEMR